MVGTATVRTEVDGVAAGLLPPPAVPASREGARPRRAPHAADPAKGLVPSSPGTGEDRRPQAPGARAAEARPTPRRSGGGAPTPLPRPGGGQTPPGVRRGRAGTPPLTPSFVAGY